MNSDGPRGRLNKLAWEIEVEQAREEVYRIQRVLHRLREAAQAWAAWFPPRCDLWIGRCGTHAACDKCPAKTHPLEVP